MNEDFVQLGVIKDFNEVCRLCLSQGGVLLRIFDPPNTSSHEEENLCFKIQKCVPLQIAEDDGLPNLICEHCLLNVDRSLQFKERCIKSDSLLRSYLLTAAQKEKARAPSPSFVIKTEVKSEPEDINFDESRDSIEEDDGEIGREIKEEQSEEVVMIVDPFSIHLDNYDDDLSEGNQDSSNYQMESMYGMDEDEGQQSQDDPSLRRHFNCNICNIGFKGREQLDRHKQIHTAGPPYPCDYCEESFDSRTDLKVHWETHKGENSYMCDVCGASYAEESTLQMHSVIHERVRPYNCPTCNKSFYYRSDLRKHAIIHTGIRPYECSICKKSFTRSTNLNKHARIHTGNRPHTCEDCGKMFGTRSDLKRHEVVHTGVKSWICSVCFIPFNRKDKLTRHEKLHSGAPRPFPCSECPTSFLRKEELTKHTQFHHYKPPSPEALALLNAKLKKPIPVNGNPELIYKKDMERGNATFKSLVKQAFGTDNENSKNQAKLLQNAAKNKEPQVCVNEQEPEDEKIVPVNNDKGKKKSSTQTENEPLQAGAPRAYQCDVCCKTFSDCRNLRKHKVIHSGIKPFKCVYCEKCFYRRRELNRHIAVHTGFKPYSCPVCHKSFSRSDKLAKHVKTHQAHHDVDSNSSGLISNNSPVANNGVVPSVSLGKFTKLLFNSCSVSISSNSADAADDSSNDASCKSESVEKLEKNPEIIFFPVGKN